MTASLQRRLPSEDAMWRAFCDRDATFDGIFFTGVRSTRIFCRPTCSARKPERRNVEFFASPEDAMYGGFRACKRCRPMDRNRLRPPLVQTLIDAIDRDPSARLRDRELIEMGIDPSTARRQFLRYTGMTFQAFARARRMGAALAGVRDTTTRKGKTVLDQQLDAGFESPSGYREAFARLFGERPSRAAGISILTSQWLDTPLGAMLAIASDDGLYVFDFVNRRGIEREIERLRRQTASVIVPGTHPVIAQLSREITEYFRGARTQFTVPLARRGTDFQRTVWAALLAIPHGVTRSYAELARVIGDPQAVRAVARANGDNYRAILIPCHRVIGSDGTLTGYGGGLARKQWLLDFERASPSRQSGA